MDSLKDKDNYTNLNRTNKWLGIIDYKSLIILLIFMFLIWNILDIFIVSAVYKVYVIILVLIPILGFFYANKSGDNISDIVYIVVRYLVLPKRYMYSIETNRMWLK